MDVEHLFYRVRLDVVSDTPVIRESRQVIMVKFDAQPLSVVCRCGLVFDEVRGKFVQRDRAFTVEKIAEGYTPMLLFEERKQFGSVRIVGVVDRTCIGNHISHLTSGLSHSGEWRACA
jgi:hypothetical protein